MSTQTTPPRPLDDELATRLLHQRIIVLGTELDEAVGNRLCDQLLLLSAEDPRRDVALWINSPGGSVPAMLAIHDVMRLIPNDVSTLAMGMAGPAARAQAFAYDLPDRPPPCVAGMKMAGYQGENPAIFMPTAYEGWVRRSGLR